MIAVVMVIHFANYAVFVVAFGDQHPVVSACPMALGLQDPIVLAFPMAWGDDDSGVLLFIMAGRDLDLHVNHHAMAVAPGDLLLILIDRIHPNLLDNILSHRSNPDANWP